MARDTFCPHPECTNASGGCFTAGTCLDGCRKRAKARKDLESRVAALEERVKRLEQSAADSSEK